MSTSLDDQRFSLRRLARRWVALLVFVLALGSVFVMLGRWQLNRLEERKARNAVVIAHENEPIVPFERAFTKPIADGDQWVRVEARGRYDYEHEIVVRYRNVGGRNGFEVVTPLRVGERTVLVDRGFQPFQGNDRPRPAAGPTGEVTVVGYVRRSEQGPQNALVPNDRQVRLINAPAIGTTLPYPVVDGYLSLISSEPGQDGALQPLKPPTLDEGPHFSYAMQWFAFTLIALAGLFVFIRGDLRDRRHARAAAAKQAAAREASARTASADEAPRAEPDA